MNRSANPAGIFAGATEALNVKARAVALLISYLHVQQLVLANNSSFRAAYNEVRTL